AEACDVSIISPTQDRSCITSWVELDITLRDMTLVHPIYMCTLNKKLFLGGQDPLDRLAPLIDCHQDQLWVQAEVQKPLGVSSKPLFVTNQVTSPKNLSGPRQSQSWAPLRHSCTQQPRKLLPDAVMHHFFAL
ncbi:hypothetical protein AMECASPLE_039354, partial [Ameca splendens]